MKYIAVLSEYKNIRIVSEKLTKMQVPFSNKNIYVNKKLTDLCEQYIIGSYGYGVQFHVTMLYFVQIMSWSYFKIFFILYNSFSRHIRNLQF